MATAPEIDSYTAELGGEVRDDGGEGPGRAAPEADEDKSWAVSIEHTTFKLISGLSSYAFENDMLGFWLERN